MNTSWLTSERQIIERIVTRNQTLANVIYFALSSAFPHPEIPFAHDLQVAINLPRQKLGLIPDKKPGDIDLLIVPKIKTQLQPSRSVAIEVKIVRPRLINPDRNANAMGKTQSIGLLSDGFPFVGLLHISIPEPSPEYLKWKVPVFSGKLGPNKEILETGEYAYIDPFPLASAERQLGRLIALDLPDQVGFSVIGMKLSKDGSFFDGNTIGNDRPCLENPNYSQSLVDSIERLTINEAHLFHQIVWFCK